MSERLHESLSALMDGEADELEFRRILAHQDSEQIDARWTRYHLARSAMQAEDLVSNMDISQRVRAAIADETVDIEPEEAVTTSSKLAWLRPLSGFAVAASVAAAVVVGVRGFETSAPTVLPQEFSASPQLASNRAFPVMGPNRLGSVTASSEFRGTAVLPSPSPELLKKQAQQRMDKYLLRHTQQMTTANGQGMIPFARVASFETE